MKRLDLVQLTIIIVGIFFGYFFISSVPQILLFLYTWMSDGFRGSYMEITLGNIFVSFCYFLAAWFCIQKSKYFANWVCGHANLEADINLAVNKSELLLVLFTGIGIYGLIKTLPPLLVNAYDLIRSGNKFEETSRHLASGSDIAISLLTLLLYFVLLYYAKVFADLCTKKINNTEPEDLIETKRED